MNISTIQQQPGAMNMGQMPQPGTAQLNPNQQQVQQAQQQQQHYQEKLDNISKAKTLVNPLKESLSIALKSAAQMVHQNSLVDVGTSKVDVPDQRFNKNIEEFYSICDQMELHLRTSIECISQNLSSARYMPLSVMFPLKSDNVNAQDALSYTQFLMTTRTQAQYAKEIHNMLVNASQTIASTE